MAEKVKETKFDVIFAIVNNGFADEVMVAAKEAGARGGTILRARGSSNIGVDKKYGITLNPEKEVLMIVAKSDEKDKIMDALYQASQADVKNKCVIFSLPIEDTVGLKYDNDK